MLDEKNMLKYETYRAMHMNLSKAMKNGFYYEAVFIEYAILEDRLASILKYARIPYVNSKGREINITDKLKKIENRPELSDRFYRERLSEPFLQRIREWLTRRNDLIHHLANIPYDHESVRQTAEQGLELVRDVQNVSRSVTTRLKRNNSL